MAFIHPDSFVSVTKMRAAGLIKEGSYTRGELGILYNVRDAIIFVNFIYAFLFMHQIMKSKVFYNFTKWIYNGLLMAILFTCNDIINVYFDHLRILPPSMDFAYVVIGLSVFSAFTMLGVFNLFVTALKRRDVSLSKIQQMSMVSGVEYFFHEGIFFLSNEFVQAFEIPEDKLIFHKQSFIDAYIADQDRYLFSDAINTASRGGVPETFTCRIIILGKLKWAHFSRPKLNYDRQGRILESMLWSVQNITEQKKDQQTLISFKNAVESSSDAVWMATPQGEKWYQNKAFDDLFGKLGVDSTQSHFLDPMVEGHILQTIKSGGQWHGEVEMVSKENAVLNILLRAYALKDQEGDIIGLVKTHTDITTNKDFEKELSRLRNYLSNIINSMPSVIIGVNNQLTITHWNLMAEQQTGIKKEVAQGNPIGEIFKKMGDHQDLIFESIHSKKVKTISRKQTESQEEILYENITIYPLKGEAIEGAVIRLDNVTDQVRMENMMIQSEKMLSLGGLAAGMAHEINNPLAGMMQNASVLINRLTKEEIPANKETAKMLGTDISIIRQYMEKRNVIQQLDHIKNSGRQASKIISNMLRFAQQDTTSKTSADLSVLLDQTIELARSDYDIKKEYDFKRVEIIKEYEENLPKIFCESSQVQQVFFNILKNGAQAMAKERQDKGIEKEKARFVIRVKDVGRTICTEIEDNGPGIPEKVRERIFEPFFTTKREEKGTGLGLSISYFIITENHNGSMRVESQEGRWTKFIINLPNEKTVPRLQK